ncbi:hypothetical protein K435DRAFT_836507 [Dendrothele bispora CBS 962.96]|uniref:Uncharacterized protein n=1 Tax=Dendrothele bispora (strain CBS 962.96) TaxID=1314807 RepID=A0A4S8MIR6_DENBC|nr:hypothetical protein K435DRAFT_836507 [Dendrothele bispora CBS 962.96]
MSSDPSVLSPYWADFFRETIVLRAVEGIFYGFERLFALSCGYFLIDTQLRTSISRRLLLIATIVMFVCSTMNFAAEFRFDLVQIQTLVNPDYDPMGEMIKWEILAIVFSTISYILGDAIVVWRAWILFDGQQLYRVLLSACILGSLGALILTNAVATCLIGYKAWYYRNFIKTHLGGINRRNKVEHILILLIEGGVIYCVLWVLILLAQLHGVFNDLGSAILQAISPHATSMYPTIIILFSALQKSHCETTLLGNSYQFSTNSMNEGNSRAEQSQVRFASRIESSGITDEPSARGLAPNSWNRESANIELNTLGEDGFKLEEEQKSRV